MPAEYLYVYISIYINPPFGILFEGKTISVSQVEVVPLG